VINLLKKVWTFIKMAPFGLWRFLFPHYEEIGFQQIYDTLISADKDRLNAVYLFMEKQYFAEIERRKNIDSKARSMISMLSTMFSFVLAGGLIAGFQVDLLSIKFLMTYVVFLTSIALASWVVLMRDHMAPQQNNFFDPLIVGHDHPSMYTVYLIYDYYQCWIFNMTKDERKARALQIAQLLFFVAVLLFAITGYDILLQFHAKKIVK